MAFKPAAEAAGILDAVIRRHDPSHVFALFSGGHDSLCSTHLASRHPRFTGVVHVNTEVGIEATRVFVRETCARFSWPLLELRPPRPPFRDRAGKPWGSAGQTAYEAMVLHWGFPGPRGHTVMYNRLKERCLRQLERDHRQGNRPLVLVTGVRRQESRRRMGHIVAEQRQGRRVWCAPLADWDEDAKRGYIAAHGLPENAVAKALCMSGECLCGSFARPEERVEIRHLSPETDRYLTSLEVLVAAAGHKRCRWGEKPPPVGQRDAAGQLYLPLCVSCLERGAP